EVCRQPRQAIWLVISPAVIDREVLSLGVAYFLESCAEGQHWFYITFRRLRVEKTDCRYGRVLRTRSWRAGYRGRCRAPKYCDEVAPLHWLPEAAIKHYENNTQKQVQRHQSRPLWANSGHSITSSAVASKVGGTTILSALAAFILMMKSNFVGCSTGSSAG